MQDQPFDTSGDEAALRRHLVAGLSRVILHAERRRLPGVGRGELAKRVNVSVSSLYAYLNGTTLPSAVVLDRILRALDADDAELRSLSTLRDEIEVSQQTGRVAKGGNRSRMVPPPRQLPGALAHLIGRETELRRLDAQLEGQSADGVSIVVIDGMGGVGKTVLGVHWAHQVKSRYPDGQLYVDLRGFDARQRPVEAEHALHGFLHALGAAPAAVPDGLADKVAFYRSLVAERRMLVFLDDARSAAQVRPLLPGTPHCLVIITTRGRFESLQVREGARLLTVEPLRHDAARRLLERRWGARHEAGSSAAAAADEIITLCAGLPLALAIAAARVARPGRSPERFADRLRTVRLEALGSGEPELDLRTVFQVSYDLLPQRAARLFRLLGVHGGPHVDAHSCAALLGDATAAEATELLHTLLDAHLVVAQTDGRFGMHDLLRDFAHDLVDRSGETDGRLALGRVLDYYVGAAVCASSLIRPHRPDELPTLRPAQPVLVLATAEEAVEWFNTELPVLRTMIDQAVAGSHDPQAWRLAWACTVFLRRTSRHSERVRMHRIGLAAARRSADRKVCAISTRLLADGLARLGEMDEAIALLESSLSECVELGEVRGVIQAHLSLARTMEACERPLEALDHARSACALTTGTTHPLARADALNALAKMLQRLGRSAEAVTHGRRSLALYEQVGFPEGEADVLRTIGNAERCLGRREEAAARLARALALERLLDDRFWEAWVLNDLADLHDDAGDRELSLARRQEALAMFDSLRHPMADTIRARLG